MGLKKQSVIKFRDLLVYCIMFKTKLCILNYIFIQIQADRFKQSFVHFENLNYASREQYYSNEFSHNVIGYNCHWIG